MKRDETRQGKTFSAFAEGLGAARRAKLENGSLVFRYTLPNAQSQAVGQLLSIASLIPAASGLFNISKSSGIQQFLGEDGTGFAQVEVKVGNGNRLVMSYDPQTNENIIKIPVRNGVEEHQAKIRTVQILADIQKMFIDSFSQGCGSVTLSENEDDRLNGKFLAFPAKDEFSMRLMGRMAASIAAAHGYSEHVHNLPKTSAEMEYPCVLVREDARDAMVKAEKIRSLPPH